jgi:hypothetical protein
MTDDDALRTVGGARCEHRSQDDNTHFSGAVSSKLKTIALNIPYQGDHLCLIHHRRLENSNFV